MAFGGERCGERSEHHKREEIVFRTLMKVCPSVGLSLEPVSSTLALERVSGLSLRLGCVWNSHTMFAC